MSSIQSGAPGTVPRRHLFRLSRAERRNLLLGLAFISSWLFGFFALTLYPALASLYYSFTDFKILQAPRWIGFDNYIHLFSDPLFWKSLLNTLYLIAAGVPLSVAVALGIALLLNTRNIPGIGVFRTIFYLPVVIPAVATSILWIWLLNPPHGLVNQLLGLAGLPEPGWFYDPAWAKNGIVMLTVWAAGDMVIIYLGSLQGVPRSLHEAAQVDGAGPLRRLWNVTIPMISPAILFNLITGSIAAFQSFAQAYTVSQGMGTNGASVGGVQNSLLLYGLNLYNTAFRYFRMGYASAQAWILLLIILLATFALLRVSRDRVYYEGEK